jgi:hypothetical protein
MKTINHRKNLQIEQVVKKLDGSVNVFKTNVLLF